MWPYFSRRCFPDGLHLARVRYVVAMNQPVPLVFSACALPAWHLPHRLLSADPSFVLYSLVPGDRNSRKQLFASSCLQTRSQSAEADL